MGLGRLRHERANVLLAAGIDAHGQAADRVGHLRGTIEVAVGDDDGSCALLGKAEGESTADAAGRAGDDGVAVGDLQCLAAV